MAAIARGLASVAIVACSPSSAGHDASPGTRTGTTASAATSSSDTASATTREADTSGGASDAASGGGDAEGTDDRSDAVGSTGTGEPEVPRWELLIRGEPYSRIVIEVDFVAGREPRPLVAAEIEATFETVLDKPAGVDIVLDETIASAGPEHAWTVQERIDLAIATSDLVVDDDTIKIHALFLDGHAEEDDSMDGVILGAAWDHENIVMFRDTLDAGCETAVVGPLLEQLCADAEFLIWQHEIGHVIGLVDLGLPMVDDHLDPDPTAGRHDISHDCVMYRGYEGLDAIDAALDRLLTGGPAIEFDAPCLADIAAVRDR